MQTFTGLEYMYISIANYFGYDKWTWNERLHWGKVHAPKILANPEYYEEADEPILMYKSAKEVAKVLRGEPTAMLMGLDATASGIQLFAALTGCHDTARNVNLINTGKREDVYSKLAQTMSTIAGKVITRNEFKHPLMTTMYGSKAMPKALFGEDTPELQAYYETLTKELTGAMEAMADIQSCWQGDALAHSWVLPDGHTAHVPVMVAVDKKIEVDELNHATFTHRAYINSSQESGISLSANIIHSLDGYVVREMVRRAHKKGYTLLTIHDSFQ